MKIIIRKLLVRCFTISIVLTASFMMLYGCATKPNFSIVDKSYVLRRGSNNDKNFHAAKAILAEISSKNELLATELGKLPEFQDGVTMREKRALENIFRFYNNNQCIFDEALVEMFKIGKPEIRKYCSPLQALFWLAEETEFQE